MNRDSTILSLIANLYEQLAQLQAERDELRQQLAQSKHPVEPQ